MDLVGEHSALGEVLRVDVETIEDVAGNIAGLSRALIDTVNAVDAVGIPVLVTTLGPIGGPFIAALEAATRAHRQTLVSAATTAEYLALSVSTSMSQFQMTDGQNAATVPQVLDL